MFLVYHKFDGVLRAHFDVIYRGLALKSIVSRGLGVQRWLVGHVPVWISACTRSRCFAHNRLGNSERFPRLHLIPRATYKYALYEANVPGFIISYYGVLGAHFDVICRGLALKGVFSRRLGAQRWLAGHVSVWISACTSSRFF